MKSRRPGLITLERVQMSKETIDMLTVSDRLNATITAAICRGREVRAGPGRDTGRPQPPGRDDRERRLTMGGYKLSKRVDNPWTPPATADDQLWPESGPNLSERR
jgi:hypothetical protein